MRFGHMAPRLPYPVTISLPPVGPDTRTQIRTTGPNLDLVIPLVPERHSKLGQFLDAWGLLESTLAEVLFRLTPLTLGDAMRIFERMGMRNALDLLIGLGQHKLEPDSSSGLELLIERVRKLNTKRNILVHGQWVLETNIIVRNSEETMVTQFLREIRPIDPKQEQALGNPKNQKERLRYTFTLKRIDATTRETNELNKELGQYIQSLRRKLIPMSELGDHLKSSRPYNVSYSTK